MALVKVKFKKDHFSGIKKGKELELRKNHAMKLASEGYVDIKTKLNKKESEQLEKKKEKVKENTVGVVVEEKVLSKKELNELTKDAE